MHAMTGPMDLPFAALWSGLRRGYPNATCVLPRGPRPVLVRYRTCRRQRRVVDVAAREGCRAACTLDGRQHARFHLRSRTADQGRHRRRSRRPFPARALARAAGSRGLARLRAHSDTCADRARRNDRNRGRGASRNRTVVRGLRGRPARNPGGGGDSSSDPRAPAIRRRPGRRRTNSCREKGVAGIWPAGEG